MEFLKKLLEEHQESIPTIEEIIDGNVEREREFVMFLKNRWEARINPEESLERAISKAEFSGYDLDDIIKDWVWVDSMGDLDQYTRGWKHRLVETEADMQVAKTILQQLGGNKFRVMTGAKDFVGGPNFLKFKIGRNSTQANMVKVTLTPSDTYNMEFFRFVKGDAKLLKTYDDIYFDQLQELFTEFTGMYTSL